MNNKSIIVIGNGGSLKNSNLGGKINQFDEVYRLNEGKTKGWEKDAGMKFTHWVTFNPEKKIKKYINGYINRGYSIEHIRELVNDVKEVWYLAPRRDLLHGWNNQFTNQLGLGESIKRHESLSTMRIISKDIQYPTTGFIVIWLLTHMYDKIYLAGFDFAGTSHMEVNSHHYFTDRPVGEVRGGIHKWGNEYKYIRRLMDEDKIEYLSLDSNIKKGRCIYGPTIKHTCKSCGRTCLLYDWENKICHYCEANL